MVWEIYHIHREDHPKMGDQQNGWDQPNPRSHFRSMALVTADIFWKEFKEREI